MRGCRTEHELDVETIPSFASKYRRTQATDDFDWVPFLSGAKAFSRLCLGKVRCRRAGQRAAWH
jgi:hypothetical protein